MRQQLPGQRESGGRGGRLQRPAALLQGLLPGIPEEFLLLDVHPRWRQLVQPRRQHRARLFRQQHRRRLHHERLHHHRQRLTRQLPELLQRLEERWHDHEPAPGRRRLPRDAQLHQLGKREVQRCLRRRHLAAPQPQQLDATLPLAHDEHEDRPRRTHHLLQRRKRSVSRPLGQGPRTARRLRHGRRHLAHSGR